jgi:hypothetical protein
MGKYIYCTTPRLAGYLESEGVSVTLITLLYDPSHQQGARNELFSEGRRVRDQSMAMCVSVRPTPSIP